MSETSNASFTPGRLRQSRGSPVRSSRFSLDRLAAAERVPDIRLDAIEAGDAGPEKVDNAVLEWLVTAGPAGPIDAKALDRRDALGLGDQAVGGTSLIFRRGQVEGDRAQASLWAVMRNAVFADVGVGYRVVGVESCGTRRYGIAVGI